MNDYFKKRCDVLRVEINEIEVILSKRMRSKCLLDEEHMELVRKQKCKEVELDNLKVELYG